MMNSLQKIALFLAVICLTPGGEAEAAQSAPVQPEQSANHTDNTPSADGHAKPHLVVGRTLSDPYHEAFQMILRETGLTVEFKDLPTRRLRRAFIDGQLMVECCPRPQWREWPEEEALQSFSMPVYRETAVLVGLRDSMTLEDDNYQNIMKLRFAVIRGFAYEKQEEFGSMIEASDFDDVFNLLMRGRADVTIVGKPEFYNQQLKHGGVFKVYDEITSYDLRLRVHRDRMDLLDRFNDTIVRLQQTGQIVNLLEPSAAKEFSR